MQIKTNPLLKKKKNIFPKCMWKIQGESREESHFLCSTLCFTNYNLLRIYLTFLIK